MKFILSLILISLSLPVATRERPVVYFQPVKTTLVGIIETQTFPGPPGYESIANGDKIESGWYLKLQDPMDVLIASGQKPMDNDIPTYNVKVVQLVVDYSKPYKKLVKNGNRVKISGRLFSQLTGHHHSRVLIEVENIEVIRCVSLLRQHQGKNTPLFIPIAMAKSTNILKVIQPGEITTLEI